MSPVDCESFRSHSIGLPFCFKLPAYPPLLSSPAVPIHRVSRISPLYLSLYPRIASAPIITALKEYTRRVIPALCEDSHRSVYVYSSSLPPPSPLSLSRSPLRSPRLSSPRCRSTPLSSGCSPLFVTAVPSLKHCVPSLSPPSPPSPPLAPSAGRSPRSFAPPCRLRYVSRYSRTRRVVLPPCIFGRSEETVQRPHSLPRTGTRTYAPTDEHDGENRD